MNRSEFDNLELLEQINYINNQLKGGYTLTKLCTSIGIGRTTVRGRFIKKGYIYNKELNTYINDKSNTKILATQNTMPYKNNTIVSNENLHGIEDFNNIKSDLLELINNKPDLMQMLEAYKNSTKIIDIPQLNINSLPEELIKDITIKSIKVYKPIYNKFDELCSQYNSIKKQDIISLALLEFYNKYKK